MLVDNYITDKHEKLRHSLAQRKRFQIHYTPTYLSWLIILWAIRSLRSETPDRQNRSLCPSLQQNLSILLMGMNSRLDPLEACTPLFMNLRDITLEFITAIDYGCVVWTYAKLYGGNPDFDLVTEN